MKKTTKIAVLTAAIALIGAITVFAKGWTLQDGEWYYLDAYGIPEYMTWEKDGNNWYYLGEDGAMVKDALIYDDDKAAYYYVDANGARVTNAWKQVEADDTDMDTLGVDYRWYYFGATGKAYVDGKKTCPTAAGKGTFAFDSEGKMAFGYTTDTYAIADTQTPDADDVFYYFGDQDDGAMKKNVWIKVEDPSTLDHAEYEERNSAWFYFQSSGKKATEGNCPDGKLYNKVRYYFDANGVMLTGWQEASGSATYNEYFSGEDDGRKLKNTWYYGMNPNDADDDSNYWFYFLSDGTMIDDGMVHRINKKYYVFDFAGKMKSGLVALTQTGTEYTDLQYVEGGLTGKDKQEILDYTAGDLYYFSGDYVNDGSMKKNVSVKLGLADGEDYTFAFGSDYKAINGYKNAKIYCNGLLLTSEDRYAVVEDKVTGYYFLVNTSGNVVEGILADGDDGYWVAIKAGTEKADGYAIYHFSGVQEYAARAAKAFKAGDTTFEVKVDGVTKTFTIDVKAAKTGYTEMEYHL